MMAGGLDLLHCALPWGSLGAARCGRSNVIPTRNTRHPTPDIFGSRRRGTLCGGESAQIPQRSTSVILCSRARLTHHARFRIRTGCNASGLPHA